MNKGGLKQSLFYFFWKFSLFMFSIFIIVDILVLIRILLKNYDEKITWDNIFETLWFIIPLTLIFYVIKKISKYYWDKS